MNRVCIYGLGNFYNEYKEAVHKEYEVVQYIDKERNLEGVQVCHTINEIEDDIPIMIMVAKVQKCLEIVGILSQNKISPNRISLGISKYGEYSSLDKIYFDDMYNMHVSNNGIDLIIRSEDEFANAIDTILFECYKFNLYSKKRTLVFDVGMNIGDSAVYFAKMNDVTKVYAFEPFRETYEQGKKNILLNNESEKIEAYNYGLSDIDEVRNITSSIDMTCGQSTIKEINEYATSIYEEWALLDKDTLVDEKIVVKKSSTILDEILLTNQDENVVIKIDCEGEEFSILADLNTNKGVMNRINMMIIEWHYRQSDALENILKENKFSYISVRKSIDPILGLIYAWKN